jgi:hypothetical protein
MWIPILYLVGAVLSYGFVKGSMYKIFPKKGWSVFDECVAWIVGMFSWVGVAAIVIMFPLLGERLAFRFRIPKSV